LFSGEAAKSDNLAVNGLVLLAVEEIRLLEIEQKTGPKIDPEAGDFSGTEKAGFAVGNSCRLFL